jgi:MFS family permease
MGAVLPVLAPHVRHDLGQTDFIAGLVIGTFSAAALTSRFISGRIADRKGRKTALMGGLLSCSLAGVAYLLPIGVAGAFLGRGLQGFGEALLYTGAAAWIVELSDDTRRARALGYLSTGIWGGICAGPAIGQLLGDFQRAGLLLVISPLIAIAAVSRVEEQYRAPTLEGPRQWLPGGSLLPGVTLGLVNVHYPAVTGFLVLHLAYAGDAGKTAISAYALMVLTSRFFLGGLPDRVHPKVTFYLGIGSMAVGLTAIALSPPAWVAIIAAGLIGFGFSFPWPSVATVVLRRVPPTARASSIGILSATVDLFVALSSFVSGAVATRFGYPSTYVVAMGALGGAVLVGRRYLADESERYSRDAEAVAGHAAASGARPESGLAPTSRSVA